MLYAIHWYYVVVEVKCTLNYFIVIFHSVSWTFFFVLRLQALDHLHVVRLTTYMKWCEYHYTVMRITEGQILAVSGNLASLRYDKDDFILVWLELERLSQKQQNWEKLSNIEVNFFREFIDVIFIVGTKFKWLKNCSWPIKSIKEHYPEALLGTNALKSLITIKYKYMHTCIKYGNNITLLANLNNTFNFLNKYYLLK